MNFDNVCNILEEGVGTAYPSACISIGIKDNILLKKSFGNATLNTIFDMASVTKIISTTMIAFKYIEEGKLRLYDRLDYFFDAPKDKCGITILDLLTHTSGLPAHEYLSNKTNNPQKAADVIMSYPLQNKPSEVPVYSCMGYILLGKILEKIGNKTIDKLTQEIVFEPLGMKNSNYKPSGDIAATEIIPENGKLLQGVVHDENSRFLNGISGNAGVFSDINDMTLFTQMLALNGKTASGTSFLSQAMLKKAIHNYTPGKNQEFRGLGFNLAGSPANFLGDLLSPYSYGHTGFTGTSIAVDPTTGLFVVLLTNRVNPTRDNLKLVRMRSLIHNCIASQISVNS